MTTTMTPKQRQSVRLAYWQGYNAAATGLTFEDNPYPEGSILRSKWEKGYVKNSHGVRVQSRQGNKTHSS